jgi:peptide subunit release factor 1 (eRF1)
MKKCPVCNSTRLAEFEGKILCKKCGYENKSSKFEFTHYEFCKHCGKSTKHVNNKCDLCGLK